MPYFPIDNKYVGLVSAFLYQRVSNVISTLWTVTDFSSSLLMMYFYWQLKKGKPPAVALAKARKWLRNLTYSTLKRLYKVIFAKLPKEQTQELSNTAIDSFSANDSVAAIQKATKQNILKKIWKAIRGSN